MKRDINSSLSDQRSSLDDRSTAVIRNGNFSRDDLHPALIRQFKLISVNFKEAALDSPCFRASVNHLDIQLNNIEKWLVALTSSLKKIPRYVKDVQSFCNSFLEHLAPTFLQEGLIDQEYTVQSLHTTLNGLKRIWDLSLQALNVNTRGLESINAFITTDVTRYKEIRRRFDQCQVKYDKYLAIFVSTPKSKESSMVMEDAKQLFEVRKEYIHASLDLIIELQTLGNSLDKILVGLNTELLRNKWNIFASEANKNGFRSQWERVRKIQSWSDSYSISIEKLANDMLSAKAQVEEGCHVQFQPSTNIDDYKSSLINSRTLNEIDERGIEKHGYLFMKTWTEKSSKPIWARRWAFIKGGIFGLLVLSPSSTFVQESDKLGVLLCSVRYAPNEDRRFCFEVRTSELTVVFQAESLIELKSWLKVFENEKQRILNTGTADDELFNVASGRYPPIILEFASTANTVMDHELTNTKLTAAGGQLITSSSLSAHIEKNEKYFQKHLYFQIPGIRPPFITDTTKSSIIAYSLTAPMPIPTALTANIWGSVNWGIYYLHDSVKADTRHDCTPDIEMMKFQEEKMGNDMFHPKYYPDELVSLDIQMRALFETAIEPGEYCVLSFSCIWSPNSKQELSGRCFVTPNHMYFYMQALGFVALFKGYMGHLVSVDCTSQKQYDMLKIFNIDGVIKMKLFLDDGKLVKKKLVCIINNIASDNPKGLKDLLSEMAEVEKELIKEEQDQKNLKEISNLSKTLSDKNMTHEKQLVAGGITSFVPSPDGKLVKYKIDFHSEYNFLGERIYGLPPKALFHALLGDNSVILKDQTALTQLEYYIKKPWRKTPEGKLYRKLNVPARYDSNTSDTQIFQEIDNMEDNSYYTFTHTRSKFAFFAGPTFSIVYKVVIVGMAGKRSKVLFFSKMQFDNKSLMTNWFIETLCCRIDLNQIGKIDNRLKEVVREVGEHGMIVKAIYLYGKLSYTEEEEEDIPEPLIRFGFLYVARLGLRKMISKSITSVYRCFVWYFYLLVRLIEGIKANQLLLFIIACSTLLNLFLMGKTGTSYWTTRRANQLAYEYIKQEPMMLQRSIYLTDMQDLLNHTNSPMVINGSRPYTLFRNKSFISNYKQDTNWSDDYFNKNALSVAKRLKQAFQDIGIRRHDLIVRLSMLNDMEREIAKAEWANWLMSEVQRCEYIKENILDQLLYNKETIEGVEQVIGFCDECRDLLAELTEQQ
ncbi:SIP3 [[Candida] subhashii]|uniref:SIP3 n=1 Tax=[Candida] subhashii TaxID=561895 RepID=A0A8J5QP84_9ASCO|nr:SIP3 [[Candida] subhashii]KAG7664020.1 SIP3 [[Candida] subhashii]